MSFPLLFLAPLIVWCSWCSREDAALRRLFRLTICFGAVFLYLGTYQLAWLRFFLFVFALCAWVFAWCVIRLWGVQRMAAVMTALVFLATTAPYQVSHAVIGALWPDFARYQMSRLRQAPGTPRAWELALRGVSPMLLEVPAELAAPPLTSMGEAVNFLRRHARSGEKLATVCDQQIFQFRTPLITVYLVDPRQPTYAKIRHLPAYLASYHDADWLLLRNHWKRNYGMMELGDVDQNREMFEYFEKSGAQLRLAPLRVREWFPVQMPNLFGHIWATDCGQPTMALIRIHRPPPNAIRARNEGR